MANPKMEIQNINLEDIEQRIFRIEDSKFNTLAEEIYAWQRKEVPCFNQWGTFFNPKSLHPDVFRPQFLPIQFFKSQTVLPHSLLQQLPALKFESSGTTLQSPAQHWVAKPELYIQSFTQSFEQRFGNAENVCVLGLLPAYLERNHSSLVYMVHHLIQRSQQPNSGFYLYNYETLWDILINNEKNQIPTVVFGVTFALLELADFVQRSSTTLAPENEKSTYIQWIETGGMKGRGKELTRPELHKILSNAFQAHRIESEYGMTELLSQAYTRPQDGRFVCPPWMKVIICDPMDPTDILDFGKTGRICVIDLANLYSCSFIATDDLGKFYADGSFEVLGRLDFSDLRGCNQLV